MARLIRRYSDGTRINHWMVALLFLCAGLTGLAIFHPVFWFFTALFGGGTWTKILHPFFGLLMVLGFVFLFFQVWRDNLWQPRDSEWMRRSPRLLRGDEDAMPPIGKYNAGQKGVFWLFAVCLLVLFVTGFVFWQPYFANAFPILLRRIAVLLHAIAAFLLILGVIIHVYAAIWVKGSVRAMTRGWVTPAWARRHHPLWYRQVNGDQ
ncbi:formate dehydrogenase subunit gamma [Ramlibacter sp. G-1-2-2]|uniref:Formate dehydrogenase subunit gamma n=1 Tax=Ramlibacter agri TaxID=2728837 RepID=A0A848HAX0_9BURK|nr:formate dehydrogenase subunit gamma [Ramlibacter agri]NML46620.1 formate dehydrogenase subunit gamma [Ramlibacter agri]